MGPNRYQLIPENLEIVFVRGLLPVGWANAHRDAGATNTNSLSQDLALTDTTANFDKGSGTSTGLSRTNQITPTRIYSIYLPFLLKNRPPGPPDELAQGGRPLSEVELLESTEPDGPVAKYIDARGEGIQHIAFCVENVQEAIEELKEKGVRMIDKEARGGAGGAKIAFIHPKETNGVLVEICERD